jgi:nitrite reductase/ring-hydroxylating ferredoxin subunit
MSILLDFLKSVAGISETKPLDQGLWRLNGNMVTVKIDQVPELQTTGGAFYLTGNGLKEPILVVSDNEGSFHCFSNRCTHFGRKLDPVPGKPVLRCCSLNHSTFDYQGNNIKGPAKKPIRVYRTELKNSELFITI